ncbi:Sec7-domain-containing protein [Sistotremastrum niveocremeum HHB9708]|uniref:Sec7-domain-containing protein n=1 Tax=Sistotremastrum niveocremeum HHB9708 TaxID=1314777 RepID=A0A165AKG3_9AGAM|nr:Sec7-domain-containing protein [Sistotremastrum niveocremeum HHB9708]
MTGSAQAIKLSVSLDHVVHSEILAVTSAMRKNSRWASRSVWRSARDDALASSMGLRRVGSQSSLAVNTTEKRETELMCAFQDLRRDIRDAADIRELPLTKLLDPFLSLIRSPLSTGPITSVALNALASFFTSGLICPSSVDLVPALSDFSRTIAHCKFEASDSSGDEVVMLRILFVLRDCICGPVGRYLGDFEICEMLETVLTTCCQMRLSEILRRSATSCMHALVREVFPCLAYLDPLVEEQKLDEAMTPETPPLSSEKPLYDPYIDSEQTPTESVDVTAAQVNTPTAIPERQSSPYGLPAVTELLRVLINLLDPTDKQHTDSTRLVSLGILNSAFEVAGQQIAKFPSLTALVADHGCKYLFMLARSDNPSVLHSSLRAISSMFETMRSKLKLQQELFLSFTMDRLTAQLPTRLPPSVSRGVSSMQISGGTPLPSPSVNPSLEDGLSETSSAPPARANILPARGETRELLLETFGHLSRQRSFMVDLYANYDCDVNCEDLFERLIGFLVRSVYPSNYSGGFEVHQQTSQLIGLDLILSFVHDLCNRQEGVAEEWREEYPTIAELQRSKGRKQLVLEGAARFNQKPKTALAFLEENGLIYHDEAQGVARPLSLAKFLKECPRLDKKLLGDFISRPDNTAVLNAFIGLFDFKGKPIADAMRELLESFRLPGEAQQIARITETFASIYFATEPPEIETEDAVYVLAYSVIMLNTDLHNPQNRKRMTLLDYQRNLKGVNGKGDFPPDYLQLIYDSIRKREIVMPEEHTGQLGFDYAWKELLQRSRKSGELIICNTPHFDKEMFISVWKPIVAALAFAITHFDDDYVVQRAITGLNQCATQAKKFDLFEVFDYLIAQVAPTTGLIGLPQPTNFNYPVVDVEGQPITVSGLSVKFGANFKGQLAAVVLFTIVNGNAATIRDGWSKIFEIYQILFLHSLLPPRLLQMEEFLGGSSMIPLQGAPSTPAPIPRSDGGLLSALSSYLMTPYGASSENVISEASDVEIENTLCSVDCISTCRLDELYQEVRQLDAAALEAVLDGLRDIADRRVDEKWTDSESADMSTRAYDPGAVFLLEVMVSMTLQAPQHVAQLWPIVFQHLNSMLSHAISYSMLLVERAVVGLLRLCVLITDKPSLRDQLYLAFDLLGSLPPVVLNGVAEQIMSGVLKIVGSTEGLVRTRTEWALLLRLVKATVSHPGAGKISLDMLEYLLKGDERQNPVTIENFPAILSALQDFAFVAGNIIENQRTQKPVPGIPREPVVDRGLRAIDLIFDMKKFLPSLLDNSVVPYRQAWHQLCLPLLVILAHQCSNPSRDIRHHSMTQLQRILLSQQLYPSGSEDFDHSYVEEIFNRAVFPLIDELLKPQVFQRDEAGMSETRLRASTLLCKVFLHFEIKQSTEEKDIRVLWIQILDLLDRLMNIDKHGPLYEAVPESLKNVILVMYSSGILVPPSSEDSRTKSQRDLWAASQERLERFLPGFLTEIIPEAKPLSSAEVATERQEAYGSRHSNKSSSISIL